MPGKEKPHRTVLYSMRHSPHSSVVLWMTLHYATRGMLPSADRGRDAAGGSSASSAAGDDTEKAALEAAFSVSRAPGKDCPKRRTFPPRPGPLAIR